MNRVTSRDGTSIRGRPHGNRTGRLILVGGGLDDGSENAPLATELAEAFTAYNYAGVAGATAVTPCRMPWHARSR